MNLQIAIIGAGSSGIAAATKLYENGFHNLIILEAEDRIGGRIYTVPFGENVMDLGAQWCHGEVGNVVHEMAQPLGLLEKSQLNTTTPEVEYRRVNGEIVNSAITNKLDALAFGLSDNSTELAKYNGSLGNYMLEKFNHEISTNEKYNDIGSELANEYMHTFQHYMNSIHASDTWFDLATKLPDEPEGDRSLNWKGKGYKTILDVMMKKIPNPELALPIDEKIFLNKRVIRIEWNKDEKADVTIVCDDGSSYTAAHVILTVSLGVLKENYTELFHPALPPAKQKAIQGLNFGTIAKIILEFENAAWPENWMGFSILWKADELVEIKRLYGDWIGDVLGFDTVEHQPKLLLGWISGLKAKEMEQLSDEEIRTAVQALLDKFLPDFNVGSPKRIKQTKWFSNKNFRGTYAYRSLVSEEQGVFPQNLAEPVETASGELVLQFAGEATHTKYYGTVNAAIETGWREAQRIIDLHKK